MRDLSRFADLADIHTMSQDAQVGTVLMLDPSQVSVSKQVRRKFRNIEEMAETMLDEGQQQPIVVGPLDKNTGKYPLQKGERRLRAAVLIGNGFKIKAIVDSTVRTKARATSSQLTENIHRDDLTPIEIAEALVELREQLKEEGKKGTGRDLAETLKKPESWVSKHLALAKLPDELTALIEDDITSDAELIQSLAKICELKPSLYLKLIEQARSDVGLSRSEAREQLKLARGADQPSPTVLTPPGGPAGNVLPMNPGGQQPNNPENQAMNGGGQVDDNPPPASSHLNGATDPNLNNAGSTDAEKVSHAKSFDGTNNQQNLQAPVEPGGKPQPKEPPRKLGKSDVLEIPAEQMVMQVRVSTDKRQFIGELLLTQVCGNPKKGMVSYLDGSKQVKSLFDLDCIEIITLAQLSQDD